MPSLSLAELIGRGIWGVGWSSVLWYGRLIVNWVSIKEECVKAGDVLSKYVRSEAVLSSVVSSNVDRCSTAKWKLVMIRL